MRRLRYLAGVWLTATAVAQAAPAQQYDFPVPSGVEDMLFYLQRSMNANTVVYQAGVRGPGQLDRHQPVRAFWLRFNNNGEKKPLKWIERKFAYGIAGEEACEPAPCVQAHIVAYPERSFRVVFDERQQPYARMSIDGRPARLEKVFLMLADGFITPDVAWIELSGHDLETGARVSERVIP